ncbi:MAG: IS630 family transposase [Bryobacteraceae bacterium]
MAVRRVKEGEAPSTVIKRYGLCRTTIYKWLTAERRGGGAALKARKHPGRKPALAPREKLQVRRWINGKDPRQYGFDFGLWTRQIVAALIAQQFGVRLGVTAVGRLLAESDITPQKPWRRAYERDPAAIERWTATAFPRLRARAKTDGAKIFFLDEAGVRSDQVLGRTWGLRGRTPEVPTSGRRPSVSAISAVNARGEFWYEIYTERLNAVRFVELLKHFMRGRRSPVFLVLDGHPAHVAKVVAEYVQRLAGRLELHFLPGYAPELNPDEFVWNHLKRQGVSKTPLRKDESLRSRLPADLAHIRSRPPLVRSFFQAPSVAYTRD